MITFDNKGNPQPEGLLNYPYADFKVTFVDNFGNSQTRQHIFSNYERYLNDLKTEIVKTFNNWVNGSFTTTKINPNDIDVVNIVTHSEELNKNYHLLTKFLTQGGSKESYLVDGYFVPVYPSDDPRSAITEQYLSYWKRWFGHDRDNNPKALIELSIV